MSERVLKCPKCESDMEEGFVLDRSIEMMRSSYWIDGPCEPPDSETGAVDRIAERLSKLISQIGKSRLRRGIRIQTYRCKECGLLESYASSE